MGTATVHLWGAKSKKSCKQLESLGCSTSEWPLFANRCKLHLLEQKTPGLKQSHIEFQTQQVFFRRPLESHFPILSIRPFDSNYLQQMSLIWCIFEGLLCNFPTRVQQCQVYRHRMMSSFVPKGGRTQSSHEIPVRGSRGQTFCSGTPHLVPISILHKGKLLNQYLMQGDLGGYGQSHTKQTDFCELQTWLSKKKHTKSCNILLKVEKASGNTQKRLGHSMHFPFQPLV